MAELHQTCFSVVSKEVGFRPYFRETDVTYYYFPEKVYLRYSMLYSVLRSTLQVPSGRIKSAWEWYHWISLEKDINRNGFFSFNFNLEYLKRLQSSEPLHTKIHIILLILPTTRNPNQNSAALRRIFSSNKSAPTNMNKEFYVSKPYKQEVGGIFVRSGSELRILFRYSRSKI